MDINRATAEKVAAAIEASGFSVASVAEQAHLPRVTLIRRLAGAPSFRIDELERIAAVLGVATTSLMASPMEDVA